MAEEFRLIPRDHVQLQGTPPVPDIEIESNLYDLGVGIDNGNVTTL